MKMKKILIMISLLLVMILSGCTKTEKVDIYTTVYPLEYVAKEIVKETKVVKSVYPRGAEVHDYEPYPKEIIAMSNSDVLFYIGLGLEPFISNALDTTFKDLDTVRVTKDVQLLEIGGTSTKEDDNHNGVYDTHVWLDPIAMIQITDCILQKLNEKYPELSETFTTNAEVLKEKLEALNQQFVEALADETILNKTIMVDHDAYAYWSSRYGISRIKLRGDNESNEVTPSMLIEKVNQARELGIKYIIATKNETESALFEQYLKNLGAEREELHHLGTITTDELKTGKNYITIMEENLQVLIKVLPRKK